MEYWSTAPIWNCPRVRGFVRPFRALSFGTNPGLKPWAILFRHFMARISSSFVAMPSVDHLETGSDTEHWRLFPRLSLLDNPISGNLYTHGVS